MEVKKKQFGKKKGIRMYNRQGHNRDLCGTLYDEHPLCAIIKISQHAQL